MSDCINNEIQGWIKMKDPSRTLNLNNLNLTEFPIDNIPWYIESIDCKFNDIQFLPDLNKFKNLKHFSCEYNNIKNNLILPSSLITLNCSTNRIKKLPNNLTKLEKLICNDNLLSDIPTSMCNLKYLDCSNYTDLSSIPQETIDILNENNDYVCNKNESKNIFKTLTLTNFNKLKELRFKNVHCEQFYLDTTKSSISVIDCSDNFLKKICIIKTYKSILCSDNKLSSLKCSICENLKILTCENNELHELIIPESLTTLNCNNNLLTNDFTKKNYFKNIRSLYCNSNKLTMLPNNMTNLEIISIKDNNIQYLPDYFENLNLSYINISRKFLLNVKKYLKWNNRIYSKLATQDEYDMYQENIDNYNQYIELIQNFPDNENVKICTFSEYINMK